MNVETQFLYPFLNALRKISRAIFFEHIALTDDKELCVCVCVFLL